MTVCFIGHRTVTDVEQVKSQLIKTVEKLISDGADTFLFGSRSQFDALCWEVVTKLKEQHPDIKRISYNTSNETAITSKEERLRLEQIYSQLTGNKIHLREYESVVKSQKSETATKNAYIMRNQEMIDDSDICVFYYNQDYLPPRRQQSSKSVVDYQPQSGTAIAFAYAKGKNKEILNLFE